MAIDPIEPGRDQTAMDKMNLAIQRVNAHQIAIGDLQQATSLLSADKAPLAFVTQTYNPLLITQNDLMRPANRPGDAPRLFTPSLGGPIDASAPLTTGTVLTTARGKVYPMFGAGFVASREYVAIEPNRVYAFTAAAERYLAVDPAGDMVRPGIAFLNANYAVIGFVGFFDWDLATGQFMTGTKRFALAAGTDIDIVAPAGTNYAQRAFQVFGGPQRTDLVHLSIMDVTGQASWSPDLSAVEGRLAAQEAIDAEDRLTALESALDEPKSASFDTRLAAEAATVPASAEVALLRGHKIAGDTGRVEFAHRVLADPGAQWGFEDGAGGFFRFAEDVPALVFGEEYLDPLTTHINLGHSDGTGLVHAYLVGDSTVALPANGGGYDHPEGLVNGILRPMLDSMGMGNVVVHDLGVGGTGIVHAPIDDIGNDCAVGLAKYLINDAVRGLAQVRLDMIAMIDRFRLTKPFSQSPFVIVTGNSTADAGGGRDWRWHKSYRGMLEELCRSKKVCVIDVFSRWPDSASLAGISMDSPAVHPWIQRQVRVWGMVMGTVFGHLEMAWRADNLVRNIPFARGAFDDAALPSTFGMGTTIERVTAGDVNGIVVTSRSRDGVLKQVKSSFGASQATVQVRTNVSASAWTPWVDITGHDKPWTASTPTVTSSAVSGGANYPIATCAMRHRKVGRMVHFTATITVSNNRNGSGSLLLTMPFAAQASNVFIAREAVISGGACIGQMIASTSAMAIVTTANAYPAVTGSVITVSGSYEAA